MSGRDPELQEIMKQLESLSGGESKGSEEEEADLKDILEALEKLEGTEEAKQEPDEDLMAYLPADQAFSEMLDLFARENRLPRDRLEEKILAYLRERFSSEEDQGKRGVSSRDLDLWKEDPDWHPLYLHLREEIKSGLPEALGREEERPAEAQDQEQGRSEPKPLLFLVPFEGRWMPYSSVGFLRRVLREGTARVYFVPWEYEEKEAVLALAFAMRDHAGVHAALLKVANEGVPLEEALSALAKEESPRPSPVLPEFWQELEKHVLGVEQKMKRLRRLLTKAAGDEGLVAELMRLGEEAAVLEKRLEELYSLLKSSRKKASMSKGGSSDSSE